MPETQEETTATTQEAPTDAASILAEMDGETAEVSETEESEAVTADEDQSEEDTEEDTESEASESDDNIEDEDEEDDLDIAAKLSLDPAIADKLPSEVKERYELQVKGIAKKERKLKEREAAIGADEQGYPVYKSYAEAFAADADTAEAALAQLTEQVRKMWGKTGDQTTTPSVEELTTDADGFYVYDGLKWASETEVILYKELQELKKKPATDPRLDEIIQERERSKAQSAEAAWVKENSPKILAKVEKITGGWKLTQEEVAQARKEGADLVKDPVMALKRTFPDKWADFKAGTPKRSQARDMVDNDDAKGFAIPEDPMEYSASHAMKELGLIN